MCSFLVNGAWSNWQEWGNCTAACGGGERMRIRLCDNPEPVYGEPCEGEAEEYEPCGTDPCPGTLSSYFTMSDVRRQARLIPLKLS